MELGHILGTAANAVLPIILLILLGYILRQKGILNDDFLKLGNNLVFHICLPSMLFVSVYDIDSLQSIEWDIVGYTMIAICVIFCLGLITAVLATDVPNRKGVLLQCTFRSNFSIIGLTLAGILGGSEAVAVASILSAFTIPLFNVLAVISLTVFLNDADKGKHSVKKILGNISKNPLILSVLLGLAFLVIRAMQVHLCGRVVFSLKEDARFLYTTLSNLKSIASPFALIVLGGQFRFSAVGGLLKEIVVGTVWRIVLAPLIGIGGAILLSQYTNLLVCGAADFPALIALFGSPVAVSSAVMASAMKNDEQLATQLVVWTSLCSVATIFLQVCILMGAGYLVV